MPNAIKYSTTIPTGSLLKGTVALGVTTADILGPTSTTGWYYGPEPVAGKYQIIETATSGDPDVYCPQSDAELIQFVKSKGATGGNTGSVAAALAWIATQPNLLATNEVYPNIVTSGSIMNLDAGFVGSYPTTASTWYDVSGYSNSGSLINGPTFNSNGYITFDGIDDIATFPANTFNSGSPQQGTFSALIKFPTLNTTSSTILFNDGGASNNFIYLYRNAGFSTNSYSWLIYYTGSTGQGFYLQGSTYLPGTWYDTTFTFDNTGRGSVYKNGELINSSIPSNGGSFISWKRTGNNQPSISPASAAGTGSIQAFKWYNRALSQTEIQQNYYQAPIVTDGLVLALDAGNIVSYESGSTTTYSLTGSISGSLVNGTGYTSSYNGSWVFDGTDDRLTFGSPNMTSSCTVNQWIQPLSGSATTMRTVEYVAVNTATAVLYSQLVKSSNIWYHQVLVSGYQSGYAEEMNVYFQSNVTSFVQNNTPYNFSFTWERTPGVNSTLKTYLNGVFREQQISTTNYFANTASLATSTYTVGSSYKGNIGTTSFYNRALTETEITQNYNAQKGRFGL